LLGAVAPNNREGKIRGAAEKAIIPARPFLIASRREGNSTELFEGEYTVFMG
jgi:hypothetical protein